MRAVILLVALLIAAPAAGSAADAESFLQDRTLYRLQVDGLVCSFCAYNVEQKLQELSGVEYVDVDVASGRVMVGVEPGHQLVEAQVRTLIENAGMGFRFGSMERRPMTREELDGVE